ncbi:hypothetical protein PHJA_001375300 [Phtheirospermum japonicum]|uniref:FLZ-type domain-containing protein n=1 Tax=Phtheirospermum japonicum TaxID=374723 RepID=A0A830C298_9LAMI|nr:hypothetical protein PHJA_001375300 [Phtheirospermum japonicum]
MLRNRSRAVTTKQALMADQTPSLSPTTNKPNSPISSFLNSPRLFNGFFTKTHFSETEANVITMSPTSILDTKNASSFVNPFGYDNILSKSPNPTAKQDTKAIGLALIDSIIDEKSDLDNNELGKISKPINRTALFGSKLKVQIPVINPTSSSISPNESPKSPADFGIKTKNSQISSPFSSNPVKDFTRQLSLKEMELSEDYTCVITHGPNPKTTHIFDDCIVESCLGDDPKSSEYKKMEMDCGFENNVSTSPSPNFLSFCHTCKDILGQGKDIYIYRGEKAFCSHECRCEEMYSEGMENSEFGD